MRKNNYFCNNKIIKSFAFVHIIVLFFTATYLKKFYPIGRMNIVIPHASYLFLTLVSFTILMFVYFSSKNRNLIKFLKLITISELISWITNTLLINLFHFYLGHSFSLRWFMPIYFTISFYLLLFKTTKWRTSKKRANNFWYWCDWCNCRRGKIINNELV